MKRLPLTTRGTSISQHPVILSEVVVREADDNAVEGTRDRLQYQHRFREFLSRPCRKRDAFYSTVTDFAKFLG
jgi:hypothetical protein